MAQTNTPADAAISFETHPSRYKHWKLTFDGEIARLGMDVDENAGLRPGYQLKLNSYDLGVDIELADAVQRLRFEHPEVKVVVVTSLKERIFCAGANIFMLGGSSHPFKVNFCKFTNETRNGIEDASATSGIKFLAAVNGTCAGGGYELALACDRILLVDDASSAVSLPEVPLLGVLPGTGGLTRVVDKRKVRRDRADFFSATAEGVKGKRAADWGFVDEVVPKSKWDASVQEAARALVALSDRAKGQKAPKGIVLDPVTPKSSPDEYLYENVTLKLDPARRVAELTVRAPKGPQPETAEDFVKAGANGWSLRAFRELDDALLRLRANHLEIGTVILRAEGDPSAVLRADRDLLAHQDHWLCKEILGNMRRVLKRLDVTSRTFYALIEPGNAFAGSLLELALAADRQYLQADEDGKNAIHTGPMNGGPLPMPNGLTRLATRFLGEPERARTALARQGPISAADAETMGLVTFAPDAIDWEDETRLAVEERVSFSPDALTGMEANLRFAGPETMETKIFGRLSAWQNWIFIRPNATGEKGALTLYGKSGQRPTFDLKRT
jgi:benzoyl-CoA-dihydrodiol lyase